MAGKSLHGLRQCSLAALSIKWESCQRIADDTTGSETKIFSLYSSIRFFFFKSIYSMIIESSLLCCPSNNVGFGDYKSLGTETTQKKKRERERERKKRRKEAGELR